MGGGSAGEIASKMIVQRIEQKLKSTGKSPAARERAVIQAAYSCNQDINNYCIEHNYESMGATLACLLLDSWDPGFATIFHSGDSRVYRWRQGKLEQMTRDHTLAEAEHINESELPKDQQGILTNVLGISSDFFLERLSCDVDNGDMFLICSDGLYRMVSDESLGRILSQSEAVSASVAVQLLLAEALNRGGHDNCSIILVKVARLGECYIPQDWELNEEMIIQEQNVDDLSDTLPTDCSE
jgi:protein phosphatase